MDFSIFVTGITMGFSLIVAIGAQNAFVLRQGLKGQHVLWVCLTCAASDAILIVLGVTSFDRISTMFPWVDPVMRYGGAAFLAWCGTKSMLSAFRSNEVLVASSHEDQATLTSTLLTCLALTWLNPHVYLDTVVLLGTLSTQFEGQKGTFAVGAICASFIFFFALGYGAKQLRSLFARPTAWRILEGGIAIVMWSIAFRLISAS